MDWKPLTTLTYTEQCDYYCPAGCRKIKCHPKYLEAGVSPCGGRGKCFTKEVVVKAMVESRGWTFLSAFMVKGKSSDRWSVHFVCHRGHKEKLSEDALRKGSNCKSCTTQNKAEANDKPVQEPMIRVDCDCKSRGGNRPKICPHHNHLVCPLGGANEWNYALNGWIKPEKIARRCHNSFWYTCSNPWCRMNYQQAPDSRYGSARCPYCAGKEVCGWNNLLAMNPLLCQELHPNNTIDPSTITAGSGKRLLWICHKHKLPFAYLTTARHKIENGTKCKMCNRVGGEQQVLGHSKFLEDVMKVHGSTYSYPEEYKDGITPIAVICSKITGDKMHGKFKITPSAHKSGQGCPTCSQEATESKIIMELQKSLDNLGCPLGPNCLREHSMPGMIYKGRLRFDRFIPSIRFAIERDGEFHFHETYLGADILRDTQARDLAKDQFCLDNGIHLLRLPYTITNSQIAIQKVLIAMQMGYQIYASYEHYFKKLSVGRDISKIYFIKVDVPKGTIVI